MHRALSVRLRAHNGALYSGFGNTLVLGMRRHNGLFSWLSLNRGQGS